LLVEHYEVKGGEKVDNNVVTSLGKDLSRLEHAKKK